MDGEILHAEGDGPCRGVVKPAPFTRRRVMACSPSGEWVAVEACAPGTIRMFRGVPAETAGGTTANMPIVDLHGRELTLDARPEPRTGETKPKEARILAMEVVPDDPAEEATDGPSEAVSGGATVFVMTADELRAFAIRRHVSSESVGDETRRFECVASARFKTTLDASLGADRGRAVGLASTTRGVVAVVAARVARLMTTTARTKTTREEEELCYGTTRQTNDAQTDDEKSAFVGFRATRTDGPVTAFAFLDAETERRLGPARESTPSRRADSSHHHFAAIGFEKEIRVVRFLDAGGSNPKRPAGISGIAEEVRRVLVDAPGPVRSVAAFGGWIFASAERELALPAFGGDAFAREPVNFAFARAEGPCAAGEREKERPDCHAIITGGSETAAALAEDPDDASVPFLRARDDPAAARAAEKTRTLRAMVSPFLPAALASGIEPEAGAGFGSATGSNAAPSLRETRATLHAFTFEPVHSRLTKEEKSDEETRRLSETRVVAASLPLPPRFSARPEICALGADARGTEIVVALTDLGATNCTDASVVVAAIDREPRERARFEDWRLVPRGTAPLARSSRREKSANDSQTGNGETNAKKTRLEAFARRFARRDGARFKGTRQGDVRRSDVETDADAAFDVALLFLTSETAESETAESETAAAGANVFRGNAKKKPAPPASLATFSFRAASRKSPEPVSRGNEGDEQKKKLANGKRERARSEGDAPVTRSSDLDRVLDAIRALDASARARFDRVEATLRNQERRLRRVEDSLKK